VGHGVPMSFPPSVPCSGAPFPPRGPLAAFPRFSGTTRHSDSLTLLAPCSVSFARRYHGSPVLRSPERRVPPPRSLGLVRFPLPALRRGSVWASQVPGGPSCARAPFSDPGEAREPGPFRLLAAAFRCRHGVGSSRRFYFEAQSRGPRTRCLRFAARVSPAPRKTRFRLGASFTGRGLNPQGPFVRFPPTSLPPLPGFSWRTSTKTDVRHHPSSARSRLRACGVY